MEYILSKLKVLEGNQGTIDPSQFCIVTDVEIPKDFKVPDFEKYNGTTDPFTHLQMYCSKMGAYLKNEKMMMYYFQESLISPAIKWYLNLDKKDVRTWNDLANAFLKQYKHNADFAPDKSSLKKVTMNRNEDFRSFALRWRNRAAQIEPPMTEKELVDAFIDLECLNTQYKYSCANATDFAHLVRTGVRIESALRSADSDRKAGKKKEDVVHHIAATSSSTAQFTQSPYKTVNRGNYQARNNLQQPPIYYQQTPQPQYQQPQYQQPQYQTPQYRAPQQQHQQHQYQGHPRPPARPYLDPLSVPQADVFKQLVKEGLMTPLLTNPWQPPYPAWYNPNVQCDYHGE
jgi:hypothetical protein